MEKYNRDIANNPNVEMIHVSQDRNENDASEWAAHEKLPWPTVLPENMSNSGLMAFKNGNYVPDYSLVTADGKKIGSGQGVFDQAKKL